MEDNKTKNRCAYCGEEFEVDDPTILLRSTVDDELLICENCIKICNEAIELVNEYFDEDDFKAFDEMTEEDLQAKFEEIIKPSIMKNHFDNYIIHQERAKKILSVAVYNHFKRTLYNFQHKDDDIKLKKSNVLMVGPSGCGKTLFVETLAKKLGVPYAIQDATSLTQAGYVGDDVEMVLKKLIENADGDIKRAETGIVFIDEIDKIGRKSEGSSHSRDVSGEGVQQALLRMLEGNVVNVPMGNKRIPGGDSYQIDTSNILFICGGAFEGIDKIISNRLVKKHKIGITSSKEQKEKKELTFNDVIHKLTPKDLRKFGMMPEILGRLPVICTLEELDRDALVSILTEPVDSIVKQYKMLFEIDGIDLEFDRECLEAIADKANDSGTGARALRAVMEDFMTEYMFNIPDMKIKKVVLTKECVNGEGEPLYELQSAE